MCCSVSVLLSGSSSLMTNLNSFLSSCPHFLSAGHYLQITLWYPKYLMLSNSLFFSMSSFFPERIGIRELLGEQGLELNTFRFISLLVKRTLDPRFSRDLPNHGIPCPVLPREAICGRILILKWKQSWRFKSLFCNLLTEPWTRYIIFLCVSQFIFMEITGFFLPLSPDSFWQSEKSVLINNNQCCCNYYQFYQSYIILYKLCAS